MTTESTTEAPVSNIARAAAVRIVNTDKEKRLTEWNPHKLGWEIEVTDGAGPVTVLVPPEAPGLNNEARHAAKAWVRDPHAWRNAYAAWVAGDGLPGAAPQGPVRLPHNAESFPEGPAFFNWDTAKFKPEEARAYLAEAKAKGAQISGCSYCNLTPRGDTCPVCDNQGLLDPDGPLDPVAAFREMVESGGNAFVVGQPPGGGILILNVGPIAGRTMAKDEATNLAAWLIAAGGLDSAEVLALVERARSGK